MLTFEEYCIRDVFDFIYDKNGLISFENPGTFEDVVFRLNSKCDTSLLLISNHRGKVEEFCLDAVPVKIQAQMQSLSHRQSPSWRKRSISSIAATPETDDIVLKNVWKLYKDNGFHGFQVLSILSLLSMPDNGCRERYTLRQFVYSLMECLQFYYMFQKPRSNFSYQHPDNLMSGDLSESFSYAVIVAWKLQEPSATSPFLRVTPERSYVSDSSVTPPPDIPQKKARSTKKGSKANSTESARTSHDAVLHPYGASAEKMELDETDAEICFKSILDMSLLSPTKSAKEDENLDESGTTTSETLKDSSQLGHEKKSPKSCRKSISRKSILPVWSDEEQKEVLKFFDNLNPSQAEQTRISLTCKYASMQSDKDLSSKQLYPWIQRKGRPITTTVTKFSLAPEQEKVQALAVFSSLNSFRTEQSRIAFTLKFLQAQYGLRLTSKMLYSWINEKPGKKGK